jgi:ABC-2 type transport system ATP-binding protein
MDAGRVLAQGTPHEIRSRAVSDQSREPTMEDAFISIVEAARENETAQRAAARGAA